MTRPRSPAVGVAVVIVLAALVTAVAPAGASTYQGVPVRVPAPGRPHVYLLGDSTLAGVRVSRHYGNLPGAYSFDLDAEGCRRVLQPSCAPGGRAPNTGVNALQTHVGWLGRAVVAMIGYNDGSYEFAAGVDAVMAEAARQGVPQVFWLTFRTGTPYSSRLPWGRDWSFRSNNLVLRDKVAQYGGRLAVIDWAAHSAGRSDWTGSDGVHLTAAGADAVMSLIKTSLDARLLPLERPSSPPIPEPDPNPAAGPAGRFVAIDPVRVLDSRQWPGRRLGAGQSFSVPVVLGADLPDDTSAVALNLTATEPDADGYLTAWPTGQARPNVSNLNVVAGETRPNAVVVRTGDGGRVDVYAHAATHVVVDVLGYWLPAPGSTSAGRIRPVAPARLVDTRATGNPAPGTTITVPVAGQAGVPADAEAAVVTLTSTGAVRPGYLTAWAAGAPQPWASNLNVAPGQTRANLALVPLGERGAIAVHTHAGGAVIVDVVAYVTGPDSVAGRDGLFVPLTPARHLDTRSEATRVPAFQPRTVTVGGRGGVPADALGVVGNLTVTNPGGYGYTAAWPDGQPQPPTSTTNVERPGQHVPVALVSGLGAGRLVVLSSTPADVVLDVGGYLLAS